jgi:FKBP-type peptidyl-prolyl cis-trans isomerase SlyD
MKIENKAVVGLTYELMVSKEENEIESAPFSVEVRDEQDPFYFIFGNSGLPEKFEEELLSKSSGESFNFKLTVNEAYGEADDELLMPILKSQLLQDGQFEAGMLEEGSFLPLVDQDGFPMQAKVVKDLGEEVLLDFNHPLVGFDLHFEGKIIEVREATPEELDHGHVHGEHGHHH